LCEGLCRCIRHHKSPTNWVLLGYAPNSKDDIIFEGSGEGGMDEFKKYLPDDKIKYVIFEVNVKGDSYNPVKFVLLTWVGEEVPPGVSKARSAAHRKELLDFVNTALAISGEFQPKKEELTYEYVASKLTRVANEAAGAVDSKRQEMSRDRGAVKKSKLAFSADCAPALKKVHDGTYKWVIVGYSDNNRDLLELRATGTGNIEEVKNYFIDDKIHFCDYCMEVGGYKK